MTKSVSNTLTRTAQVVPWAAEALRAFLSATIALAILWAAYAFAWPLTIDVGGNDHRFVWGFHEPEQLGGRSMRWTDGDSTLLLPRPPAGVSSVLALTLLDSRPERAVPLVVRLIIDETEVTSLVLHDYLPRKYHLLLPSRLSASDVMQVDLQSDAPFIVSDGRHLGVVVFDARLMPQGGALLLPCFWLALCALSIGVVSYAALRLASAGSRMALLSIVAGTALIALGVAARPLEVLPYLEHFVALAAIACLGVLIIRLLVPLTPVAPGRPGGSGVLVAGEHAAIVLAVVYWMAVLYQRFMVWNGATSLGPSSWTIGVGMALAGTLGLGWPLWWGLRGRWLPPGEGRTRGARIALVVLAATAGLHLGWSLWYAFTRQAPDFWILFRGVRAWVNGGSLYDLEAVATNHFGHVFKVPPFYGMFFVPLVRAFDGQSVLVAHRVMNVTLFIATVLIWLQMWRLPPLSLNAVALLIVFNFRPLADTIAFGQIDLVLLFVLTAALWALRAGRDGLAGALVALGALFKLYPVVLLAFFVLKRRWAGLWGFALGMLLFNALAIAVMGWEMHRVYLFEVLPKIGGTTAWIENQTISGFVARLAVSPMSATIFQDQMLRLLGIALSASVALVVCALALIPADGRSPAFALQYGLFLLLMVLCVPAAWMHYQTLLVLPFAAMLLYLRGRRAPLGFLLALGLSFALIAYGNQWSFFNGTVTGVLSLLGISYKLYGMLLLGFLSGVALLTTRRPVVAASSERVAASGEAPVGVTPGG
ncbi:MAG: glycosyltransferase family 87 protein [Chloroflexaceae bacterium]